jgi:hypothetical protein
MLRLLRALMLSCSPLWCALARLARPQPSLYPSTPVRVLSLPVVQVRGHRRMRRNQKEIAASQGGTVWPPTPLDGMRNSEPRRTTSRRRRRRNVRRLLTGPGALHMDRINRTVTAAVEASLVNPAGAKWGPASPALVESPHGSSFTMSLVGR